MISRYEYMISYIQDDDLAPFNTNNIFCRLKLLSYKINLKMSLANGSENRFFTMIVKINCTHVKVTWTYCGFGIPRVMTFVADKHFSSFTKSKLLNFDQSRFFFIAINY